MQELTLADVQGISGGKSKSAENFELFLLAGGIIAYGSFIVCTGTVNPHTGAVLALGVYLLARDCWRSFSSIAYEII